MKAFIILCLLPLISFAQVQIGSSINGDNENDESGYAVATSFDGNVIATSSPYYDENRGVVKVFENNNGNWSQVAGDIVGESIGDISGRSIAMSADGTIVAIGAAGNDGSSSLAGHVRVFEKQTGLFLTSWQKLGSDIDGDQQGSRSGFSVSLSEDGKTIAIGAPFYQQSTGQVKVYSYTSGSWSQIGSPIDGLSPGDWNGRSVSLSSNGNILAIGADRSDVNGSDSGQVRVFEYNSGDWNQIGGNIDGAEEGDRSGFSVSISDDGSVLAVGSLFGTHNGQTPGVARVYKYNSGTWTQIGADLVGVSSGNRNGRSLSLSGDGNWLAVGEPNYNTNSIDAGRIRLFNNQNGTWTPIGTDILGQTNYDQVGFSLALSGDGSKLVAGIPKNDENGDDSGQTKVYDISALLSSDDFVLSDLKIFPNPATHQVNIKLNQGIDFESVNVYNSMGQQVKTSENNLIDVSDLSKGSYFFEVKTNEGKATKTILIY